MLLPCIAHLHQQQQEWRNIRLYGQERNLTIPLYVTPQTAEMRHDFAGGWLAKAHEAQLHPVF